MRVDRVRSLAVVCGAAMLVFAGVLAFVPAYATWDFGSPWASAGAIPWFRVDRLSSPLPALAASLWLLTVVVTPRMLLGQEALRRSTLTTVFSTVSFLSTHPIVLALAWAASVATFVGTLPPDLAPSIRRIVSGYVIASAALFGAGALLLVQRGALGPVVDTAGLVLIILAALIRKGIVPFHAWIPTVFEHGRLGPSILFISPQLGTYVIAVLVVPSAPTELLRVMAVMALITG